MHQNPVLDCGGKRLNLQTPVVMGVLNVTPDSFSDGGRFLDPARAVKHARGMEAAGAGIIDIGGESTRPGAENVPVEEELRRVLPVIEALAPAVSIPLSIDTSKPQVMRAAVQAGAGLINDVCALGQPDALETAADLGVPVCLMHMQGEPRTMQTAPRYGDVVSDVCEFLSARVERCRRAGIPPERLLIDPGFGFGKTLGHNLALLANLAAFGRIGPPVLVGLSRKSMFGKLLDRETGERLAGGLAAALLAVDAGASVVRTHDVRETVDALAVWQAVVSARAAFPPQ